MSYITLNFIKPIIWKSALNFNCAKNDLWQSGFLCLYFLHTKLDEYSLPSFPLDLTCDLVGMSVPVPGLANQILPCKSLLALCPTANLIQVSLANLSTTSWKQQFYKMKRGVWIYKMFLRIYVCNLNLSLGFSIKSKYTFILLTSWIFDFIYNNKNKEAHTKYIMVFILSNFVMLGFRLLFASYSLILLCFNDIEYTQSRSV